MVPDDGKDADVSRIVIDEPGAELDVSDRLITIVLPDVVGRQVASHEPVCHIWVLLTYSLKCVFNREEGRITIQVLAPDASHRGQ